MCSVGGPAALMQQLAPTGPVYQAGTLSGNPVAVAAGIAALDLARTTDPYSQLDASADVLTDGLATAFADAGIAATINREASLFSVFFTDRPVRNFEDAAGADHERYARFFHHMLDRGVYLPPSGYELWTLCTALGPDEIDHILRAAESFGEAARRGPVRVQTGPLPPCLSLARYVIAVNAFTCPRPLNPEFEPRPPWHTCGAPLSIAGKGSYTDMSAGHAIGSALLLQEGFAIFLWGWSHCRAGSRSARRRPRRGAPPSRCPAGSSTSRRSRRRPPGRQARGLAATPARSRARGRSARRRRGRAGSRRRVRRRRPRRRRSSSRTTSVSGSPCRACRRRRRSRRGSRAGSRRRRS